MSSESAAASLSCLLNVSAKKKKLRLLPKLTSSSDDIPDVAGAAPALVLVLAEHTQR